MDREPKISEIEKLIKHFRETNREHELFEILERHRIKSDEPVPVVDEQNEFHEEGLVLNNIAAEEGFLEKKNFIGYLKKLRKSFKEKWYFRYAVYYLLIFIVILGVLNAPIFLSRFGSGDKNKSQIITTQELQKVAMADSAPLDPGEIVPANTQLVVPKINVNAPIVFSPTSEEKIIQEYLTKGVVHYPGTAVPGTVGNSFITGHSSNFWWIKGNYNYVFVNLDKLAVGDQAKIYHNGKKFVYQVSEIKVVSPTDVSVLAATDTPVLTLMTCTPPGTNWKRLIVRFEQISPKYTKPQVVTKEVTTNPINLPSTDNNSIGGWFNGVISWIAQLFGN